MAAFILDAETVRSRTHVQRGLDDRGVQPHEVRIHPSQISGHPPARGPDGMEGPTRQMLRSSGGCFGEICACTNSRKSWTLSRETHDPTRTSPVSSHRPRPPSLLPRLMPDQLSCSRDAPGHPPPLRPENADLPQEVSWRNHPSRHHSRGLAPGTSSSRHSQPRLGRLSTQPGHLDLPPAQHHLSPHTKRHPP